MKTVIYAPRALERLDQIYRYRFEQWGEVQADLYYDRLIDRIEALAAGKWPHGRSCELLVKHRVDASGLKYYREGSHYIVFRDTFGQWILLEIFHKKSDLERRITRLTQHEPPLGG